MSARDDNRLAPAREGRRGRSMTPGDAPETVLGQYLIERGAVGRAVRYFRDHRETEPRFTDTGRALKTGSAYPDAVRDMLRIARHRGWDRITVSGDPRFRREAWVQARSLGLEVRGYRPTTRDRQAAGLPEPVPARSKLSYRLDQAAVIVRGLIADPEVQARLLTRAFARAARHERPSPDRRPDRER